MIAFGSAAAASSPGFYTQEEGRAAVEPGLDSQELADIDAEEEDEAEEEDKDKGKKRKRKATPSEPRVKWSAREDECLVES
jgi:hypothetical protein